MIKKTTFKIIDFYQILISPLLGDSCRFYPSCSNYMKKAIEKYGFFIGIKKGFYRILKCNPYHKGGIDEI